MRVVCRQYILTSLSPHVCKVGDNVPQLLWWRLPCPLAGCRISDWHSVRVFIFDYHVRRWLRSVSQISAVGLLVLYARTHVLLWDRDG